MGLKKVALAKYALALAKNTIPPDVIHSRGSTVLKETLDEILRSLGDSPPNDKVDTAKRIATKLRIQWSNDWSCEDEASLGGGTITKSFYLSIIPPLVRRHRELYFEA